MQKRRCQCPRLSIIDYLPHLNHLQLSLHRRIPHLSLSNHSVSTMSHHHYPPTCPECNPVPSTPTQRSLPHQYTIPPPLCPQNQSTTPPQPSRQIHYSTTTPHPHPNPQKTNSAALTPIKKTSHPV